MAEILQTKNLTASYTKKPVLNQVSLDLKRGEFVCLCGPNGSGKSTLLSLLANLGDSSLKITSVELKPSVDNKALAEMPRKEVSKLISFMTQEEFSTWDFSVFDVVLSGRYAFTKNGYYTQEDKTLAKQALEETGLTDFADRSVHELSGGEFQKVRIARTICQNPEFMLMDEPASSLDFVYEPELLTLLQQQAHKKNRGVLITIHDINLAARYADRIILLPPQHPAISGTVEEVFTSENLSKTFGKKLKTYMHPVYNKLQVAYEEK